jgi:predicted AlkP superfamily phosphohydrolase/phosphomutase
MKKHEYTRFFDNLKILSLIIFLFFILIPDSAECYIGPGAGFAFITSFFFMFMAILVAFLSILFWPLKLLIRIIRKSHYKINSDIKRVVVVGLDGLDPDLTEKFMNEGKLPNFSKLSKEGCFKKLKTTYPAISPVAWSSFITGANPGKHNIYDFLTRNKKSYLPDLSSAYIGSSKKVIKIGKYNIPLGKPEIKLFRKGKPFWSYLGEKGILSSILRVPITFPPEKFKGMLLSAMCVPDLKGTQGTFTFYSTEERSSKHTGGVQIKVARNGNIVESYIPGPINSLKTNAEEMRINFKAIISDDNNCVTINLNKKKLILKQGVYSDWFELVFKAGLGIKVTGICRFLITEIQPNFKLYITPINIAPDKPSLPISHPFFYATYLAKLLGKYSTLGLAEDTWALNERVIDDEAFLNQCYTHHKEREKMLFASLEKIRRGLVVCVFDTSDRIQHMFFRYLTNDHPALGKNQDSKHKNAIEEMYIKMDELIGKVREKIDEKSVLIVMSDHGFKLFKRGVDINFWLCKNGYMALKDDASNQEWYQDVDWKKTKAFAVGLGGIYLNLKGREAKGIVEPGEEEENLKNELISKLNKLEDVEKKEIAILDVFDKKKIYNGPYTQEAPDLIVGFNNGYRASWDCAIGRITDKVFEDNSKNWSGDHCVNPDIAPGILFSNKNINTDKPSIMDIGPTVLKLFGLDVPVFMDGKPLI